MNVSKLIEYADSVDLNLIFMEGFDNCVVGITNDEEPRVVYSEEMILDELTKKLGSREGASDYYDHNIAFTDVGELTPLIIRTRFV